jgi:hypothetical protein
MHGFTNYEQSKALYERGYRHPDATCYVCHYGLILKNNSCDEDFANGVNNIFPAFSLADIVTMQGERFYMPPQVSVAEVIEYNMKYMLENDDVQVDACNQRLRGEYE